MLLDFDIFQVDQLVFEFHEVAESCNSSKVSELQTWHHSSY